MIEKSLLIYGNNLLTEITKSHLKRSIVIIYLICTLEFCIWVSGTIGFLGEDLGNYAWLVGILIALVVTFLIYSMDVTIITYDFARDQSKNINKNIQNIMLRFLLHPFNFFYNGIRFKSLIVTRIIIVLITATVTTFLFSRIMLDSDIQKLIENENLSQITEITSEKTKEIKTNIADLITRRDIANLNFREEVAGLGQSKKGKEGPISDNFKREDERISLQIEELKEEIKQLEQNLMNKNLSFFERKYGLNFKRDATLADKTENLLSLISGTSQKLPLMISLEVFIVIIFLSVMVMKVFQPRSTSIYFNENIQGVYEGYLNDKFNEYLQENEKNNGSSVPPLEFEIIYNKINKQARIDELSPQDRYHIENLKKHRNINQKKLDEVKNRISVLNVELQSLLQTRSSAISYIKNFSEVVEAVNNKLKDIENSITEINLSIKKLENLENSDISVANAYINKLAKHEDKKSKLTELLSDYKNNINSQESDLKNLNININSLEEKISNLEKISENASMSIEKIAEQLLKVEFSLNSNFERI